MLWSSSFCFVFLYVVSLDVVFLDVVFLDVVLLWMTPTLILLLRQHTTTIITDNHCHHAAKG